MHVTWACKSDVGIKREINEDNFAAQARQQFFVVADGMGGHAGGELASRLTAETMEQFVVETREGTRAPLPFAPRPDLSPESNRVHVAIRLANREVYDTAVRNPALAGMGSTVVALLLRERMAFIGHVGDSRCYLLRGDKLTCVTRDHSYVNELIDEGKLDPAQAYKHKERNIITRALGVEPDVLPDVQERRVRDGDVFLLCSDGLSDRASDRKLEELLQPLSEGQLHIDASESSVHLEKRMDGVLSEMIRYANARGGDDNITAMLIKVRD